MRTLACISLLALAATAHAGDFKLQVDTAKPGGTLAQRYVYRGDGCTGDNVAPALRWENVPVSARSLALTVFDPDTPSREGWWHWVIVDLPIGTAELQENGSLPTGAHALRNDYGKPGWGGPCPPQGDKPHRYVFTLHALDVPSLDLPADAPAAKAGALIERHTVAQAQVTLLYGR